MGKSRVLLIILALSFVVLLMFLLSKSESPNKINQKVSFNLTSACFGEKCFKIQIADSQEEREKGLMFVSNMPEEEGMLFIFENEGVYPFWMKNTLIPLDIIWLGENQSIVFIKKNALPCKEEPCEIINPGKSAKYVLEINSGIFDKLNLENIR